ncbi:hypothetical protein M422DRAFT_41482 [Sphaerobolus stellatus SS14]|nr:hypothetical protein M422DRAFT_41482 [Sphaerobolus stellatus SS14]
MAFSSLKLPDVLHWLKLLGAGKMDASVYTGSESSKLESALSSYAAPFEIFSALRQGGSQFTKHLQDRLKKNIPPGTTDAEAFEKLKWHEVIYSEEMPEDHIRMLARLFSYNSSLVDSEWRDDMQSPWNISKEVQKATNIKLPCPLSTT